MVIRGDSCTEGCGFESQYRILDGHCFTFTCCKNQKGLFDRMKINKKEAGNGPVFKKNQAEKWTFPSNK